MVRRTPRARCRSAFALVDVMVGAILVGISLAVVIGLSGRALTSQKQGEELATAANLADGMLHLVLARGPDEYAKRFPVEGPCEPPFADYRYRLDFSAYTFDPAGGSASGAGTGGGAGTPYRVRVTINWSGRAGTSPQSLVVETLMATRNGGDDPVGGEPDPQRTPQQAVSRDQ